MSNTLRTFIAVPINFHIQNAIGHIQNDLKKVGADIKWVNPKNIHITLKFLGEISSDKIENVSKILHDVIVPKEPFSMPFSTLGAFPKIERPKVLWIGNNSTSKRITEIAQELEEALEKIGFEKEKRKFEPHLTIGRVRSPINKFALSKKIKKYEIRKELMQDITEVNLYKSTLRSHGPLYEILKTVTLSKR